MKQVYLIFSLNEGEYKIGISKYPEKRIKQLQTGNPSELKILYTFKSELSSQIESALHRSYYAVRGEWFSLTIEEELDFLNQCKKIETNLRFLRDNPII